MEEISKVFNHKYAVYEEELRCIKCHKKNIRFRMRINSYICNVCGYSWDKINKEVKEEEDKE